MLVIKIVFIIITSASFYIALFIYQTLFGDFIYGYILYQ